jgi:hypothetical protein
MFTPAYDLFTNDGRTFARCLARYAPEVSAYLRASIAELPHGPDNGFSVRPLPSPIAGLACFELLPFVPPPAPPPLAIRGF